MVGFYPYKSFFDKFWFLESNCAGGTLIANNINNGKMTTDTTLTAQFPPAPNDLGVFTEVLTKTTYTENTVTRVTNNSNMALPTIEEVCFFKMVQFTNI